MSQKKSWTEHREEVRSVRRWLWGLAYRCPNSFAIKQKSDGDYRIFFMSSPPNSKFQDLYMVDIKRHAPPLLPNQTPSVTNQWNLRLGFQGSGATPSKEEELQMERRRMAPSGISAYEFHSPSGTFLFNASTALYSCVDTDAVGVPLELVEIPRSLNQGFARLNPELCPHNADLLAYVANGDIFVSQIRSDQGEVQLTFTCNDRTPRMAITAGYPSYIIQEEFNRFEGYWWHPVRQGNVYQILYEEVDESDVGIVSLLSTPGNEKEEYRFPTAGSPNAKSTLKIVEFALKEGQICEVKRKTFSHSISNYFPWAEYLVRAGWTPDGKFAWAQLLDRPQERLELILIPPPKDNPNGELSPPPCVIYAEVSTVWINVHDILEFFPNPRAGSIEFVWASEESGFRHLYKIKSRISLPFSPDWPTTINPPILLSPLVESKVQLTSGNWEVINSPITVDFRRNLVYFMGLMNSPLERHLYVVSFRGAKSDMPPQRLTSLGSYNSTFISLSSGLILITYSNTCTPPRCLVTRIICNPEDPSIHSDVKLTPINYLHAPPDPDPEIPAPLILTHELSSGETIYAMVYRPVEFDSAKKYPTILNIYGGPEVQLVYNSFKGSGQLWLCLLISQGYCVISIDSRGSNHRGVEFESHIRRRMGTVELEDQVEVLKAIAGRVGFIDMKRVGIYGWSYGGYLTLMGLAQYPDVFKVAVAGAPVTSWELYDTGYTERYMGLPESNFSAYQQSSVLSYVHQFPDEEGRLLIVHGLLDENVHFTHTTQFISALVKAGKPHTLQIYPNERHSLRKLEASEHYETTLLSFLYRNL